MDTSVNPVLQDGKTWKRPPSVQSLQDTQGPGLHRSQDWEWLRMWLSTEQFPTQKGHLTLGTRRSVDWLRGDMLD